VIGWGGPCRRPRPLPCRPRPASPTAAGRLRPAYPRQIHRDRNHQHEGPESTRYKRADANSRCGRGLPRYPRSRPPLEVATPLSSCSETESCPRRDRRSFAQLSRYRETIARSRPVARYRRASAATRGNEDASANSSTAHSRKNRHDGWPSSSDSQRRARASPDLRSAVRPPEGGGASEAPGTGLQARQPATTRAEPEQPGGGLQRRPVQHEIAVTGHQVALTCFNRTGPSASAPLFPAADPRRPGACVQSGLADQDRNSSAIAIIRCSMTGSWPTGGASRAPAANGRVSTTSDHASSRLTH